MVLGKDESQTMKKTIQILSACAAAALLAGCAADTGAESRTTTYVAHLQPLNTAITGGQTMGEARLVQRGNELDVDIRVQDAPAGIVHWQHFHGFEDGSPASCPGAAADANGDGIVDLLETEPSSGTTMVPFISEPQSMDIPGGTYPTADAAGAYDYQATIPLDALQAAFNKSFPDQQLDLDRRVIFIHGVPESTALPASVQSLGPIPAQTTLPIACGVIELASIRQ